MWERPIRIGDFLKLGDSRGTVEAINTRSTRIRRVDGVHLLIPNSFLLENAVVNWTLVDRRTRTSVRVGVSYGSPVKLVAQLLERAVNEQEGVLDDPKAVVFFKEFADNALNFAPFSGYSRPPIGICGSPAATSASASTSCLKNMTL